MRIDPCAHCGNRLPVDPFTYEGQQLCWSCTAAFVSWMLDGGAETEPELFAHLIAGEMAHLRVIAEGGQS